MKNKFSVCLIIRDYFRSFYMLNKFFFYSLFQNLLSCLSPAFACLLMNFKQKIFSKNSLFFYESEKKLFEGVEMTEEERKIARINEEIYELALK